MRVGGGKLFESIHPQVGMRRCGTPREPVRRILLTLGFRPLSLEQDGRRPLGFLTGLFQRTQVAL
jgi:hypothetical protein